MVHVAPLGSGHSVRVHFASCTLLLYEYVLYGRGKIWNVCQAVYVFHRILSRSGAGRGRGWWAFAWNAEVYLAELEYVRSVLPWNG